MTSGQIKYTQQRIGAEADGFWGPKSIAACKNHLRAMMPTPNPWPESDERSLLAFYGVPGDESQLVNLPVQGLDIKYDGTVVKTLRCHRKVANSLSRILIHLDEDFPSILADYNGCFNFRKMRGGSSYSLHARGAAIDFMAESNGNHAHWPTAATMPIEAMEIFAREGWLSAGAFWGRDAMHFQATR